MTTRRTYREHVENLSKRKPSLEYLRHFISCSFPADRPCRIASLTIHKHGETTIRSEDFQGLASTLDAHIHDSSPYGLDKESYTSQCNASIDQEHPRGRMIIIEDLSKEIIELLGSSLDLDPIFFAGHLHTAWENRQAQTPHQCSLPSQAQRQNFVNIHYHRVIDFDDVEVPAKQILRYMNIDRKVVIYPISEGKRIGMVQHCTSVLLSRKGLSWLGLILVDRPLDGQYTYNRKRGDPLQLIHLASCPFLGGYEDFLDSPSLFDSYSPQLEQPFRLGLLDDLLLYWSKVNPAPFIGEHLNLIAVAHYPLRIVAAEWIIYVAVMYRAIKQYEYTTAVEGKIHQELEKLDADMRALQRWRRRSLSTGQKIKAIITVLHAYEKTDSNMIASLLQDYEYLSDAIETFGERLESMLPFVASLVQIVDSRRSFSETANISRLTIVALVFVPLAYVSSLFSMTGELGLGGSLFWLYFAVAIPVTTTVFLIVRPPLKLYRRMGRSARSVRFPRVQAMRFWERLTGSKTGL